MKHMLPLAVSVLCLATTLTAGFAPAPEPGITAPATVVSVYDGDTVTVQVAYTMRVRLLDCWAPEIKGTEKPDGLVSKAALEAMLPPGTPVIVHIPVTANGDIGKSITLGRVLANIWTTEHPEESVSERMVAGKFATISKQDKQPETISDKTDKTSEK